MHKLKRLVQINKGELIKKLRQIDRREVAAYVLFSFGLCLAVFIGIPLFLGAFGIIWGDKEIPSATASLQLALVSTALGGVVLWYVAHLNTRFSGKSAKETKLVKRFVSWQRRGALMIGTMLLFAAMCFTLFALLCPIFPEVKDAHDMLSVITKWTAVLSLMMGSIALGFSLCIGISVIFTWSSTND